MSCPGDMDPFNVRYYINLQQPDNPKPTEHCICILIRGEYLTRQYNRSRHGAQPRHTPASSVGTTCLKLSLLNKGHNKTGDTMKSKTLQMQSTQSVFHGHCKVHVLIYKSSRSGRSLTSGRACRHREGVKGWAGCWDNSYIWFEIDFSQQVDFISSKKRECWNLYSKQ